MSVIYTPSGKAREYSELACNLYSGCKHRCLYCFCPSIMRKTLDDWAANPKPRTDILKQLEREAKKLAFCDKELLFSFMSDPYQTNEAADLTRKALLICESYGFKKVNVLTKAGTNAVRDFDIFERNSGWKFGSTIIFDDETLRQHWEPGAPSIESRFGAIHEAHKRGIYTWVSVEPVVDPQAALRVIRHLKNIVNFWKVGKLNHFPGIEKTIDWAKFLADVRKELAGHDYYIKKDLFKFEQQS